MKCIVIICVSVSGPAEVILISFYQFYLLLSIGKNINPYVVKFLFAFVQLVFQSQYR